mgnify:CR=1 FL=1
MAKRPGSSNTLRLIGGRHGGRKLKFPEAKGLRPTADRTRETLFNWLAPVIEGSHCLDLFAGSGALGFEAVSRGAAHVSMVEMAMPVFRQLQQNVDLLDEAQHIDLHHLTSRKWLEQVSQIKPDLKTGYQQGQKFDVVFLDPPFKDNLLEETLNEVFRLDLISPSGFVYVERDIKQEMPGLPENCSVVRDKTAGQVAFSLIECH